MTKNILLAASALSVLAFAGAASAHDLTFRAVGGTPGLIGATDTGGATEPYDLAEEARVVSGDSAVFQLSDTLSGGSSLPSGNVLLTVNVAGGTFDAGVTGGNITADPATCPTFTATISSGGAAGSASVTYIISNSSAGCSSFDLDLPILPTGASDVTVSSTLRTEAGTPIDGLTDTLQIIDRVNAFNLVVDSAIGGGALGDTYATLTETPVYTEFFVGAGGHGAGETASLAQLGTIEIEVDTTAYRNLQLDNVAVGDLTQADVVVTGNYNAFPDADVQLAGVAADDVTASVATFEDREGDLVNTTAPFTVEADGVTAIAASNYSAQVSYVLNNTFYTQEGPFTNALERIGRDGTNVVFPWLNDNTVSSSSGTTNRIRMGNVGSEATGPVYAEVLNSSTGVSTPSPVQIAASIPAGGELRLTTAQLTTALGAFGRGDVRISVEAPATDITARRYLQTANGGITELSSGTVASDQTPADTTDVE